MDKDLFKVMRTEKQERKEKRREAALKVLETRGIEYDTLNNGHHLVLYVCRQKVNFWPGTGRWRFTLDDLEGFGLKNLLKEIDEFNA